MSENLFIREKNDLREDYSDTEEALSLCDLPLGEADLANAYDHNRQSSSDHGLFEFFIDYKTETTTNMSSAEDIILSGKLLPYRSPTPLSKTTLKCVDDVKERYEFPPKKLLSGHRKSESLNDLPRQRFQSSQRYVRKSHSLDYKKLSRDSSSKTTRTRSSLLSSNDRLTSSKPRWRLLMFGFMRTPTEIELKDIKNRQNRRIPASMIGKHDEEETGSAKKEEEKGSWKLLRVLSCKGEANGVIPSLSCIPHV